MGGRGIRRSSRSDDRIIEELNRDFIPVELNLTDHKFRDNAPALEKWRWIMVMFPSLKNGFVATVVVDPTGRKLIGDAGSSSLTEVSTAINYNSDKYLAFLKESLKRFEAWEY